MCHRAAIVFAINLPFYWLTGTASIIGADYIVRWRRFASPGSAQSFQLIML